MSKSYSTLISNKSNTGFSFQNKQIKSKKNIKDLAIEECKKLYTKNCVKQNQYVLNQLKKEKLNIYLNNLKSKDLTIISKILSKYFYFKHIELSPFDPEKEDCSKKRKNRLREIPSTQKEFSKLKPQNALEKEKNQNIYKILMGISRYLSLSDNIISLSLNSVLISKDSAKYLAQGLLDNKTIQGLNINYCIISLDAYEMILKSLLKHEVIEYLDLSNNNFNDKYGEMIALIISSQTQRRDVKIWASGLRNEFPSINEYSRGLVSINLRGNKLGNYSAECICKALSHDQYIRIIDLSENNLDDSSCKKFIHMMRKNNILLTVDLRENPGYDETIYQRMIMKMSKNIRFLYQQFQNGNYTEEEFENLKDFIDISFFDVDIPQEIVDYYNGNVQDTLEENGEENQMPNNNKLQLENMNVMNDIQERAEEEEDEGTIKTIQEQGDSNNQKTEEENKKLMEENIQLKQQILELKSQKTELENKNNKNKANNNKIITKPDDPNNIEENYSYIINLINELNEVMNNIENIKKKKEKNVKPSNKKNENIEKNKEDNYINKEESNEEENNIINNNQNIINQNQNQIENGNYQKYPPGINIDPNQEQEEEHELDQEQEQDQMNEDENEMEYEHQNEEEYNHDHEIEKGQNIHSQLLENQENMGNEQNINNNDLHEQEHDQEQEQDQDQEIEQEIEQEEEHQNNDNNNVEEEEELQNKNGEENEGENEGENVEVDREGEEGIEEGEGENDEEEINLDDLTEEEKMALFQQQEILQKLQEEAEARGEHFDVQEYLAMLEKQANEEEEEEADNKGSDKVNKSF